MAIEKKPFQIKKAALYVRISREKQEMENQLLQLRDYCNRQNYTITHEFKEIISGKEITRPEFSNMLKSASKKEFDMLVFWDISRFSRAGTLYTLAKLNELERYGIEWESFQEPYFRSIGPFKDVVLSVMATLAKIEREKISERTKAGLERARANGKQIGKRGKDKRKRKVRGYFKE